MSDVELGLWLEEFREPHALAKDDPLMAKWFAYIFEPTARGGNPVQLMSPFTLDKPRPLTPEELGTVAKLLQRVAPRGWYEVYRHLFRPMLD